MKVIDMPQIQGTYPGAYSIQNIVSAWRENGKNYMVVYNYTPDGYKPRSDAFELCEFVISTDTTISYTTLDHVPYKAWPDPNTPYYSYEGSFLWSSGDNKEHTLVVRSSTDGSSIVYKVIDGKLVYQWRKLRKEGSFMLTSHGIRALNVNGYTRGVNPVIYIYEGNPAGDSIAIARVPIGLSGYGAYSGLVACGDVNGDGLGDVAVTYTGNNQSILRIYLGADSVSSVSTADSQAAVLSLPDPQVSSDGLLSVLLNINHPSQYTLEIFSLRGQKLHVLMDEYLQIGEYRRTLQLSGTNLPSGMYNLRLSDGTRMVDKGILITR
jgi:hypothetical protein